MSTFAEVMESNAPRIVILFRLEDGQEQFQWGVEGSMPVISAIGYLARIQAELIAGDYIPECDHIPAALVIAWDADDRTMQHFVSPEIPRDSLVGMIETIKSLLVDSRLGQQNASNRVQLREAQPGPGLLGPDGRPMRM